MPEVDEISLLRPHVARREAVVWAARVDAKALGDLNDPRLRPPPPAQDQARTELAPEDRAIGWGAMAAGALVYALLLALKHRDVTGAARERGVQARPLVPLGIALRVAFAGPMLAIGVAWQMLADQPLGGSLLVLAAMILTCYLPPRRASHARGPGRWLPLAVRDGLHVHKTSSSWLDASTWPGKAALTISLLCLGLGVWQLSRLSFYHAHLVAIDGVVLLSFFGTGLRRWLPGDPVLSSAKVLRAVAELLRADKDLKVMTLGRIPTGSKSPDEIRLMVRAKSAVRGFVGIEVGVGWFQGMGGPVALPEVLVRVADGTACHEAMTKRLRAARWVRGRETHERVLALSPRLPTSDYVARLVRRLGGWISRGENEPEREVTTARRPRSRGQPRPASISARMSSGRAASTPKPRAEALPFQDKW